MHTAGTEQASGASLLLAFAPSRLGPAQSTGQRLLHWLAPARCAESTEAGARAAPRRRAVGWGRSACAPHLCFPAAKDWPSFPRPQWNNAPPRAQAQPPPAAHARSARGSPARAALMAAYLAGRCLETQVRTLRTCTGGEYSIAPAAPPGGADGERAELPLACSHISTLADPGGAPLQPRLRKENWRGCVSER